MKLDELVQLGGSIHQDDDPPLSEADDAIQQAGIERYLELLDDLSGDISPKEIAAILWSLHPIEDYGIYEAAYSALSHAAPAPLGTTAATVLPLWLLRHGEHRSIASALLFVSGRDEARQAFLTGATSWSADERAIVLDAVSRWAREDEGWEPVVQALGGSIVTVELEPIPKDWPEEWQVAAEAFRESGRVDRAWTNEADFPKNFPRVIALIELGHGSRWREVPHFLNPILVRRRDALPAFVQALAELPEARRDRILETLQQARPDVADALTSLLDASR